MIGQGLTLTIIGMSIVFVFLAILVFLMTIMSRIVRNIDRKRSEALSVEETEVEGEGEDEGSPEIAAAIAAYLRAGGILPAPTGDKREDLAAVLAAIAAAGGPVPKGKYNEIAAAIAAVRAYK